MKTFKDIMPFFENDDADELEEKFQLIMWKKVESYLKMYYGQFGAIEFMQDKRTVYGYDPEKKTVYFQEGKLKSSSYLQIDYDDYMKALHYFEKVDEYVTVYDTLNRYNVKYEFETDCKKCAV